MKTRFLFSKTGHLLFFMITYKYNICQLQKSFNFSGGIDMIARFESRTIHGHTHTSANKYKNLRNLPHWHMEHELVYVENGCAELMAGNNLYCMTEGMSAFIHSEDIHYIKGDNGSIIHIVKTDSEYMESITAARRLSSPVLQKEYGTAFAMEEISEELKNGMEYSGIIADSIATRLIAEIFRGEDSYISSETGAGRKHKKLFRLIAEEYSHITFEEAASYMNFSEPYFSKYFHKISGMTFTDYLNTLKVSAAVEKISQGKMSITEISIDCGFGSIRNFNRIFKKFTGYSPRQLPASYVFIYNSKDISEKGFNPTLNCTELL